MADTRHTTTLDIKVDDREIVRLGQEIDRAFTTKTLDSFAKMMERTSQALTTLIKQQEQLRQSLEKTHKTTQDQERSGSGGPSFLKMTGAVWAGNAAWGMTQALGGMVGAAARGGLTEAVMRAVPLVGGPGADVAAGAQKYYQGAVAAAEARMGAYGKTGLGSGAQTAAMGWAARMGIDPLQTPAMLAQIAAQTGLSGGKLSPVARDVAKAQRFGGIDSAGAVIGAAGEAGGDTSPQRSLSLLRDTIGSALQAGIREARLDQYFQGLSSLVDQMRSKGIMLEPESVNALVRGLGAVNAESLKGMAGFHAATGMANEANQATGGRGMLTSMIMKVMGVGTGGKGYFQAMREFEANPYSHIVGKGGILELAHQIAPGVSDETMGGMLRNMFPSLSRQQGYDVGRGDPEAMGAAAFGGTGLARGEEFIKGRTAKGAAPLGMLPTEKGRRLQEIALGENKAVESLSQHLLQLDLDITKSLLPGMAKFVDAVVKTGENLFKDFAVGGPNQDKANKRGLGRNEAVDEPYTEEDRAEFNANRREFGQKFAEEAQAGKLLERQDASEAWIKSSLRPDEPASTKTGGSSPGTAKAATEAIAFHLEEAAILVRAMGNPADMSFTEAEVSGGH